MSIWKTPISLGSIAERSANTMAEHLGIEFIEFDDNSLTAIMPVDHRTTQPLGIMHGGASCVLAETVGSTAANYAVDQKINYCVGLDINTNHIRSIRQASVCGVASPFFLGRSTQVWSITIKDEAGRLISVNRLTMAVMTRG